MGREGTMAWLEEGLALYDGSFLGGFFLADGPAFEEWALLERERLVRDALRTQKCFRGLQ